MLSVMIAGLLKMAWAWAPILAICLVGVGYELKK